MWIAYKISLLEQIL